MVAIAAVTTAVRHSGQERGSSVSLEDVMPEPDSIRKEAVLGRMTIADSQSSENTWVPRRIVLTDTELCCGKVNYPKRLDHIPLHEVINVEALHTDNTATSNGIKGSATNVLRTVSSRAGLLARRDSLRSNDSQPKEDNTDEVGFEVDAFSFEITVTPDGHNSGRSTILKTKDRQELSEWIDGQSCVALLHLSFPRSTLNR